MYPAHVRILGVFARVCNDVEKRTRESHKLWRAYTGRPFTGFSCDVAALEVEGTAQVREGRLREAISGIRAQFEGKRNCA